MAEHPVSRRLFTFVFTFGVIGLVLIVTGFIGWRPPGHINPAQLSWRTGVWTGYIIWNQIGVGVACLAAAGLVARRVNRQLARLRQIS